MKKKLIALVLMLALALTVGLTACASPEEEYTYTGEYTYPNAYNAAGDWYGAKVDVTVKEGKITKVKLYTTDEAAGLVRTSPSWANFQQTEDAYAAFLEKFVGKTVGEIRAVTVTVKANGEPNKVSGTDFTMTGATQSAGRIILAIQNALTKPAI